ncbi:hypothetical protein [Microcoleus sp. FACHB-68]|uniref:hypothetical protein n=1 Tax=Microcoleus sp. FACHB-68 TaxID=2692826 RepID=UPI0016826B99|nr:hypothetical protein [Microcoleus sp. FACHB-68]MBD1939095.1 hypothetical protein [Microcoleus sp. FACHB-68]
MALPEGFNEFEFLQDAFRKLENRKMLQYFADLGPEDTEPDVTTPRGTLRYVCTHKDSDTAIMTLMRAWIFFFGQATAGTFASEQTPIYGMPVTDYDGIWTYTPQVKLIFREDPADVEQGFDPIVGEIGFRLVGETSETLTLEKVRGLARAIEREFEANGGYVWKRGWEKFTYFDKAQGYDLRILANNQTTAEALVNKVLDVQGHVVDWTKFYINNNSRPSTAYPTLPAQRKILGKTVRHPRRRPRTDVRFLYAHLFVHGLAKPMTLVNRMPGGESLLAG